MGLFRKKPSAMPRPLEFGFLDDAAWNHFNDEVPRSLRRLGMTVERLEPGLVVTAELGPLGLLNVAQLCNVNAKPKWPAILDEHFTTMRAAQATEAALDASQLRVRLLPDDWGPPEARGQDILVQPFAESVIAALAFDLPTTVQMAGVRSLADLELDLDLAWDLAWSQTRANERIDEHEVVTVGGAELHSIFGASFYVSSLVRYLPDLIEGIGEHGAIVSIPRRHTILAHVIRDLSAAHAVQAMIADTRRLFAEGPGSVSAHLYWWRAGELAWLPVQVEDGHANFFPPDDFIEMLNALPPPT